MTSTTTYNEHKVGALENHPFMKRWVPIIFKACGDNKPAIATVVDLANFLSEKLPHYGSKILRRNTQAFANGDMLNRESEFPLRFAVDIAQAFALDPFKAYKLVIEAAHRQTAQTPHRVVTFFNQIKLEAASAVADVTANGAPPPEAPEEVVPAQSTVIDKEGARKKWRPILGELRELMRAAGKHDAGYPLTWNRPRTRVAGYLEMLIEQMMHEGRVTLFGMSATEVRHFNEGTLGYLPEASRDYDTRSTMLCAQNQLAFLDAGAPLIPRSGHAYQVAMAPKSVARQYLSTAQP